MKEWLGLCDLLTKESNLVQSSWSSSEQYMGLCPMVMIHGRAALFSGLLASCQDAHMCQINSRRQWKHSYQVDILWSTIKLNECER